MLASRRDILLRLLDRRGLTLSTAQRRQIERCTDLQRLDLWLDRVVGASSTREVFAADSPEPGARVPVRVAARGKPAPATRRARRAT